MRSPAAALALVVVGLAAPAVVSLGCGGAEWKPVAGPTVFPVMPVAERHEQPKRHPNEHHDAAAAASASANVAAPVTSGSASAKPATSAKPPKAPPPPPKKKLPPQRGGR